MDKLTSIASSMYVKHQYHNWSHAWAVRCAIMEHWDNPPAHLILAAIFHDIVYIPGAANGVNEAASAEMLNYVLRATDNNHEFMRLSAAELIRSTDIATHMQILPVNATSSLAILLDADLHSLAAPYDQFVKNQENILMENLIDPLSTEGRKKTTEFLNRMASVRSYIFHTKTGRDLWEQSAISNINQWTSDNK
jgi:predicted metal-dependent HD superfamily phosphohydrolase